jgi:phospholipase C
LSPGAMPVQEKGIKCACALPYQLHAEAQLNEARTGLVLTFESAKAGFGQQTQFVGAAFSVSALTPFRKLKGKTWDYAVSAADQISDTLDLKAFDDAGYNLQVRGPNGFFRNFKGSDADPDLKLSCGYEKSGLLNKKTTGNVLLILEHRGEEPLTIIINTQVYDRELKRLVLKPKAKVELVMNLAKSSGWYDFTISSEEHKSYLRHYAGHVETAEVSITDPFMGGIV